MNRRTFLGLSSVAAGTVAMAMVPAGAAVAQEAQEVSPAEDLMREHGVLRRCLLVYEAFLEGFDAKSKRDPMIIRVTAGIIHDFIESYHEKLEEEYIFPRAEKVSHLQGLVATLRKQHNAGRAITKGILDKGNRLSRNEVELFAPQIRKFIRMYRPHAAREDTVLFPEFRKLVSESEWKGLGETFEKIEHQRFGEKGFEQYVQKVAALEERVGIADLNKFTP